jgi:hypothetical protein
MIKINRLAMKRLFTVCICLFTFGLLDAQPQITFSTKKHDFGSIKEADGKVSYMFTFTNTGNAPLAIQNVEASCGCTSPEWTKEPVKPGKSGMVKATFDPKNRPGHFVKQLTITSNASNSREALEISGSVVARVLTVEEQYPFSVDKLRFKSGTLEMYKVLATAVRTENFEVYNSGDTPAIVQFENVPAHFTLSAEPVSIPAKSKGVVRCVYNAAKKNDFGVVEDDVTLKVRNSRVVLKVRANIEEDFSKLTPDELENAPVVKTDKTAHSFGKLKTGETTKAAFTLTNNGKSPLLIRKLTGDSKYVKPSITSTSIKPGQSASLTVELTADSAGEKMYGVTVVTNAPKRSNFKVYLTGTVE